MEDDAEAYELEVLRHVSDYLPSLSTEIRNAALGVVRFESAVLDGERPATQVVVRLAAAGQPGKGLGLRVPVWDAEPSRQPGDPRRAGSRAAVVLANIRERLDKYRPSDARAAETTWIDSRGAAPGSPQSVSG